MSIYKSILVELDKASSISTKYNRLVTLKYKTEDSVIIDYIDKILPLLLELDDTIKRKLPSKSEWYREKLKLFEDMLRIYCNDIISSNKPEWMIIAERNGWAKIK